jgi:hypothetical protein
MLFKNNPYKTIFNIGLDFLTIFQQPPLETSTQNFIKKIEKISGKFEFFQMYKL